MGWYYASYKDMVVELNSTTIDYCHEVISYLLCGITEDGLITFPRGWMPLIPTCLAVI